MCVATGHPMPSNSAHRVEEAARRRHPCESSSAANAGPDADNRETRIAKTSEVRRARGKYPSPVSTVSAPKIQAALFGGRRVVITGRSK